jgi:long-subunit fatty acid transport protein
MSIETPRDSEFKQLVESIEEKQRELDDLMEKYLIAKIKKFSRDTANISNIKFFYSPVDNQNWTFSYDFKTSNYKETDYLIDKDAKNIILEPIEFACKVIFGYKDGYFISGGTCHRFSIYKNSSGLMRIINKEYQIEVIKHADLINSYTTNINIPEYLALQIMLQLFSFRWTNEKIISYFKLSHN